jgi:hypothetical protein
VIRCNFLQSCDELRIFESTGLGQSCAEVSPILCLIEKFD